jgi:hypothetical protein
MSGKRSGSDRRGSVRFEVVGPVHGTAVSDRYVQIHNVSAGGALIESHWPLPIEARVSLKLTPGALEDSIETYVRHIARLSQTSYLIGLEFINHDPALLKRLRDLVGTIG